MSPYIPITVQDPKTKVTHVVNDHIDSDLDTLCGIYAGQWVGFDDSTPTCKECLLANIEAKRKREKEVTL